MFVLCGARTGSPECHSNTLTTHLPLIQHHHHYYYYITASSITNTITTKRSRCEISNEKPLLLLGARKSWCYHYRNWFITELLSCRVLPVDRFGYVTAVAARLRSPVSNPDLLLSVIRLIYVYINVSEFMTWITVLSTFHTPIFKIRVGAQTTLKFLYVKPLMHNKV